MPGSARSSGTNRCSSSARKSSRTYNHNVKTNLLATDRFGYDVLNQIDLQRTGGYSHGTNIKQLNWGNYDLIVIYESHNFRNHTPGEVERVSLSDQQNFQ